MELLLNQTYTWIIYVKFTYNTEKDYYIHKFAKNLIAPAGWSHHDDG